MLWFTNQCQGFVLLVLIPTQYFVYAHVIPTQLYHMFPPTLAPHLIERLTAVTDNNHK
jgi:hypothetical protein